jgi:hypothetical protein
VQVVRLVVAAVTRTVHLDCPPGLSTWTVHVPDASAASADDTCLHAPMNDYSGDHHEHDCYF